MPAQPAQRLTAVLFDMDGTIVDTEPVWRDVQERIVVDSGGRWSHDLGASLVGRGLLDAAHILQEAGVQGAPDEIVDRLCVSVATRLDEDGIAWRPGALELLHAVRTAGLRTALVTMSYRGIADAVLHRVGFDAFDTVVAGDDVVQAKPHPECYATAMQRLGVDADRCVAVEDSLPGATAAVAAGVPTVVVPQFHEFTPREGVTVWPTLTGRTVADLVAVRAQAPEAPVLP